MDNSTSAIMVSQEIAVTLDPGFLSKKTPAGVIILVPTDELDSVEKSMEIQGGELGDDLIWRKSQDE
jgi:hypothetical protein